MKRKVRGEYDSRNIFICFISCFGFEIVKSMAVGFITSEDYEARTIEDVEDVQPVAEQGGNQQSPKA